MATLRDLITQRDEKAKQDRVKGEADDFAAAQDPNGNAPEEEGLHDADFLPDAQAEQGTMDLKDADGNLQKVPALRGVVPLPSSTPGSRIAELRQAGMPEEEIAKAAQNVRTAGSHRFTNRDGSLGETVGQHSPLGQELRALSRDNMSKAEAAAPGYDYGMRRSKGGK